MARKSDTSLLKKAKANKSDEFYTQLSDIERELKYYSEQFKNKVVYCNCDDPHHSNFVKYFVENYQALGLKKLIACCYKRQQLDIFNYAKIDAAFSYEYSGIGDLKAGKITQLESDGDFRSPESIALLEQSDIIVTNPPFSLFRQFVKQIIRHNKKFLIIGNINAITYKEIFNLIKNNKVWLGVNLGRGISGFIVPEHYQLYGTEARINNFGERIVSTNNCLWLTNLDLPKRHIDIPLKKTYFGNEDKFPKYDNYDGINVNKTKDIPKDYSGAIGVPITFLHKFNPDQFEILRFRKGNDDKDLSIDGKCPYFRILVKNKRLT